MEEKKNISEKLELKKNNNSKDVIKKALKRVFSDPLFVFLAVSSAFNILLLYYFVFLQTTTFSIFWDSNTTFYNVASLLTTLLIGVLFGIVVAFLAWQLKNKSPGKGASAGNSVVGAFFGAIATGCPVCGAFLVSLLGIGGGLTAFPLQGLEVKALSIFLLSYAIFLGAKVISNDNCDVCEIPDKDKLIRVDGDHFVLNVNKKTLNAIKPFLIILASIIVLFAIPFLNAKFNLGVSFQKVGYQSGAETSRIAEGYSSSASLFEVVNPKEGYTINATWGDLGPKVLQSGAIDLEKFKQIYQRAGQPLTDKQLKILTEGSNEKITINRENAYFLINFLWALGLVNENPILDRGPLSKYGSNIGRLASTGGWTIGTKKPMDLYSSSPIIKLTDTQQRELDDFANNSYRPCCNNSTAFADCNHGMAALALGQIMAANGASADEMFEALKYFNAFWFPQQYIDLAKYFQIREGKDWDQVDPRVVMGKNYSTASGWSRVKNWLAANNAGEKLPVNAGGCGV